MGQSSFHAYYKARLLENYAATDKLIPVYASSSIEIYPHQIAAAMFALRSPYLKGVVLCDEGGLGKSYIALLIALQKWYEGQNNILLVVPTHLIDQWRDIFEQRFTVPFFFVDSTAEWDGQIMQDNDNAFSQEGIVVTTYDYASEKADALCMIRWDVAIFDEADVLCRVHSGENKTAVALKAATDGAYKILLTPTPILTSIMDIYDLIYFIDETALPDPDAYYKRYFRKPENYPELAGFVSKYCFRTLRAQVKSYIKIPERILVTAQYTPTCAEQALYSLIDRYLSKPQKIAYPQMDPYDLTLMYTRAFSSSIDAVVRTLSGALDRLEKQTRSCRDNLMLEAEITEFRHMVELGGSITETAKGNELIKHLKTSFSQLKKLGAKEKALIFTENRETQKYLGRLLKDKNYKVLTYHGGKSRELETIKKQFRDEADILITTDLAARGPNFEFCSLVVNYDIPYNTLILDQRINRCHRIGQQSDVIMLNFLNPNNYGEVRTLELINKRIQQFSGIFGMTDAVAGFGVAFADALASARTRDEIDRAYTQALETFEEENKEIVHQAEHTLFTSFSKEVADGLTVTPQYIKEKIAALNEELWQIATVWFSGRDDYVIDEQNKTITLTADKPPRLFYYWTGNRNIPYTGLKSYGLAENFKPKSGRITPTSVIGRGIIHNIECADSGSMVVNGRVEPCELALYSVEIKDLKNRTISDYEPVLLVGKTEAGRILTDDECKTIMTLPVLRYAEDGRKAPHWLKSSTGVGKRHELDSLVDTDAVIKKWRDELSTAEKAEADRLRAETLRQKAALTRKLDGLRTQIAAAEKEMACDLPRLERITAQKKLHALQKELKLGEQNLFFDGMRLEQALEEELSALMDKSKYTANVKRQFVIRVEGT